MKNYLSNGLLDIVYVLICLGQLYLVLSWTYHGIFQPMASAPGSRDSAGLLIVAPVVFGGAVIVWALISGVTRSIMGAVFPNWEHVLFKP